MFCFFIFIKESSFNPKFFQKPEEQRLIYQGKLLRDTDIFEDFLRDLDHEQTHTLHLVYTLKRTPSAENNEQTISQTVRIYFTSF